MAWVRVGWCEDGKRHARCRRGGASADGHLEVVELLMECGGTTKMRGVRWQAKEEQSRRGKDGRGKREMINSQIRPLDENEGVNWDSQQRGKVFGLSQKSQYTANYITNPKNARVLLGS